MECTFVKPGRECTFMSRGGCGYGAPSENCEPVVESCAGCDHVEDWDGGQFCKLWVSPAGKWSMGACNMATHIKIEQIVEKKVNPLKASKRAQR